MLWNKRQTTRVDFGGPNRSTKDRMEPVLFPCHRIPNISLLSIYVIDEIKKTFNIGFNI